MITAATTIKQLDELSKNDLVDVQKFVDFLIYKKRNEDKNGI